jgi:hypothetical protein
MLLSPSIGTFCTLLFFDKFSLLLVLLVPVAFKTAHGAVIDDETLLPDCNNIVDGPTKTLPPAAAAAFIILCFFCETIFCLHLLWHAFAGYFA